MIQPKAIVAAFKALFSSTLALKSSNQSSNLSLISSNLPSSGVSSLPSSGCSPVLPESPVFPPWLPVLPESPGLGVGVTISV